MAELERIGVEEARALLDAGWTYLDVRTEEEFEAGHVPGAVNVPVMLRGPDGMQPNPAFESAVLRAFARDARLVVGCRSGNRSLRAGRMLIAAGFTQLVELRTGWDGARDAFGRLEPGWSRCGLPVETGRVRW
jgi:rhodanese-related sulfurtransferase